MHNTLVKESLLSNIGGNRWIAVGAAFGRPASLMYFQGIYQGWATTDRPYIQVHSKAVEFSSICSHKCFTCIVYDMVL